MPKQPARAVAGKLWFMWNKAYYRIMQFYRALTAVITEEDRKFLQQYLCHREEELFFSMALPEQRHSLNTACCAKKMAMDYGGRINEKQLVRAALLHDVGKAAGDMSPVDKSLAVLADAAFPQRARSWAKKGRGGRIANLRHALYVYYHHAEISYEKLSALGLSDIAEIAARHHKAPAESDPLELLLLRKADAEN